MEWVDHEVTATSRTRVMLHGLTRLEARELVPLAASWLQPPALTVMSPGYSSRGYSITERAYVLSVRAVDPGPLEVRIDASAGSPLHGLCLLIEGWGDASAEVAVDGALLRRGAQCRAGRRERLGGIDLVLWLDLRRSAAVTLRVRAHDAD